MHNFALFTEILFKIKSLTTLFLSTSLAFILYPINYYLTCAELVTSIPIYMPGVDEKTTIGYSILSSYHIIAATFEAIGFGALDFFIAIIIWFVNFCTFNLNRIESIE